MDFTAQFPEERFCASEAYFAHRPAETIKGVSFSRARTMNR